MLSNGFENTLIFYFIFLVKIGIPLHLFNLGLECVFWLWETDECKTHLFFEFILHAIFSILYLYSCKTHNISSKLGFAEFLMENK